MWNGLLSYSLLCGTAVSLRLATCSMPCTVLCKRRPLHTTSVQGNAGSEAKKAFQRQVKPTELGGTRMNTRPELFNSRWGETAGGRAFIHAKRSGMCGRSAQEGLVLDEHCPTPQIIPGRLCSLWDGFDSNSYDTPE